MKKNIGKVISTYLEKHAGHTEKIKEFSNFIEGFFDGMEEDYQDVKDAFYDEVEDFTEEVDETMIRAIIDNLRKRDGTVTGLKWSIDETESVCRQYDAKNKIEVLGKTYDPLKFWFAMNYVYAVHNSVNRTVNGYVELAIDEIMNKNICLEDLVKRIFKKM